MSSEELRPCPNPACRSTNVIVAKHFDEYGNLHRMGHCLSCGMSGPLAAFATYEAATENKAVEFWNALRRGQAPQASYLIEKHISDLPDEAIIRFVLSRGWTELKDFGNPAYRFFVNKSETGAEHNVVLKKRHSTTEEKSDALKVIASYHQRDIDYIVRCVEIMGKNSCPYCWAVFAVGERHGEKCPFRWLDEGALPDRVEGE